MGEGKLREQSANPGSRGKMAIKMECVCECVLCLWFDVFCCTCYVVYCLRF